MLSSAISGTPMLRRISAMPSRSWAGSGCSTSSRSNSSIARMMRIACLAVRHPMLPSTRSFTSGADRLADLLSRPRCRARQSSLPTFTLMVRWPSCDPLARASSAICSGAPKGIE